MYNQCNAYRAYIFKPSLYLIYPSELQVKDTTDSRMTTADLDIFLNIETDVRLHTNIYDKRQKIFFKDPCVAYYLYLLPEKYVVIPADKSIRQHRFVSVNHIT